MIGFDVPGRADDQAEMKAIIDKAIKAHGGQEKLNKEKTLTMKGKGTFYGMGAGIGYTAEFAVQPPGQSMVRIEAEANGMKFTFIKVVNGDKAWQKTNDQLQELDKEA